MSKAERLGRRLISVLETLRGGDDYISPDSAAKAIDEVHAILAEPDPPASDAGAEIVAALERAIAAWDDLNDPDRMGTEAGHAGRAWLEDAREILTRHQTRRVVVVELDDGGVADAVAHALTTEEGEAWDDDDVDAIMTAFLEAYRAQHPQPTGGV